MPDTYYITAFTFTNRFQTLGLLSIQSLLLKTETRYGENELVGLLKERSNIGFAYLYENYSDALYGVITDIIKDDITSQDILQDVFINIFRKIDSYDANKSKLFTWIMAISRNLSIDFLKNKGNINSRQNSDITLFQDTYLLGVANNIDHIGLRSICMKLEPKYYRLIYLSYFQGFTHEEIATLLEIPLGTVKNTDTFSFIISKKNDAI